MTGDILTAELQKADGSWAEAAIELAENVGREFANRDGKFVAVDKQPEPGPRHRRRHFRHGDGDGGCPLRRRGRHLTHHCGRRHMHGMAHPMMRRMHVMGVPQPRLVMLF